MAKKTIAMVEIFFKDDREFCLMEHSFCPTALDKVDAELAAHLAQYGFRAAQLSSARLTTITQGQHAKVTKLALPQGKTARLPLPKG